MSTTGTDTPGSESGEGGHPVGKGLRPAFHALWPLAELGVVTDLEDFGSETWKRAAKRAADAPPVRVAIIDTPVAYDHPNLAGAIDLGLMRDFSVSALGAFVVDDLTPEDVDSRAELLKWLKEDKSESELSTRLLKELAPAETPDDKAPSHGGRPGIGARRLIPSAHGTALAGLIGARPTCVRLRVPAYHGEEERPASLRDLDLPYCGINPFCRIVPISIGAGPEPGMLAGALAYACLIHPDVVVIADSWDRPEGADRDEAWCKVEDLFLDLCRRSLVFCAVGNEPTEALVYPASLARTTRTTAEGKTEPAWSPCAVGACDSDGADLTFSPDAKKVPSDHLLIRTLSTEQSRYDRDRTRLDPWDIVDKELGRPAGDPGFPPRDIITTDVPGPRGYNPSPYDHAPGADGEHFEIASLFCRFSGTSAATAIAAGLVSLALAAGPGTDKTAGGEAGEESDDPRKTLFDLDAAERFVRAARSR